MIEFKGLYITYGLFFVRPAHKAGHPTKNASTHCFAIFNIYGTRLTEIKLQ